MATKINIEIDQGTDFSKTIFRVRDVYGNVVDLSGLTGACTLRKNYTANTGYNLSTTLTANGDVVLSGNSSTTSGIIPGRYVYDVISKDTTDHIARVVEGYVTVNPAVTAFVNTVTM
jgi:hypothetical protein